MSEDNRSTAGSRPAQRTPAAGRSARNRNTENLRRSGGTAQNSGRRVTKQSSPNRISGQRSPNRISGQSSPNRISGQSSRNTKGKRKKRPEIPPVSMERNSNIIDGITFGFSLALLLGAAVGCVYLNFLDFLTLNHFKPVSIAEND